MAAADGASNAGIARDLAVCEDTVRKWRSRYAQGRLAGLRGPRLCMPVPVVERKVVTPNDFYDLADIENMLMAFQDLYDLAARPFNLRYTKRTSTHSSPASPPTNQTHSLGDRRVTPDE